MDYASEATGIDGIPPGTDLDKLGRVVSRKSTAAEMNPKNIVADMNRYPGAGINDTPQSVARDMNNLRTGALPLPTSTRVSTTSKVSPVDAQLNTQLQALLDATSGAVTDLKVLDEANRKAGAVHANAAMDYGSASQASIGATTEAAVRTAQQKQDISKAYSFSINDPNSSVIDAIARVQDAHNVKNMLQPELARMAQTTFLDNPVQWIQDYFQAPKIVAAWHAADMQEKTNTQYQAEIEARVNAHDRLDPAMLTDVLAQKGAADQKMAAAEAIGKAAAALTATNALSAQMKMKEIDATQTGLQGLSIVARESAIKTQLSQSDKAAQDEEAKLANVNIIRNAAGMPAMLMTDWKGLSPAERAVYETSGAVSGARYGDTLAKSVNLLTTMGATNSIARTDPAVTRFIVEQRNSDEAKAVRLELSKDLQFQKMSLANQDLAVLDRLYDNQEKAGRSPQSENSELKSTNPYKFKLENALLTPELVNNPVTAMVKTISDAHGVNGKPPTDLELRDQIYAAAVREGPKAVPALAQQLSQFYMVGLQKQLERTGALRVGYKPPVGYGVMHWNADKGVQMASPSEIEHAITSYLARKAYEETSIQLP